MTGRSLELPFEGYFCSAKPFRYVAISSSDLTSQFLGISPSSESINELGNKSKMANI